MRWLLICVVLVGCGGKTELRSREFADEARPRSYLVGLCEKRKLPKFFSFHEEQEFFRSKLNAFREDARVQNLNFLSSLKHSNASCEHSLLTHLEVHSDEEGRSLLKEWESSGRIDFWEPDYWNTLKEGVSPQSLIYDEEGRRWWTDAIHLVSALEDMEGIFAETGQRPIYEPVIAVLDGGIDYTHPSLSGRIWQNSRVGESECLDDEWGCNTTYALNSSVLGKGDAYPFGTDYAGDLCSNERIQVGDCMHATHIAGILVGDVRSGIPGVCPYCKIMNIRVLENVEGVGRVSDSAVLRGLKYLSGFERESGKNLVRVVSLSFGKYQKGKALGLYIEHLAHVRDGILVFAAAGNEDTQKPIFPAAHRSVISVTGLSASGKKATYSNYGSWVNIAAPGGEVREGREYAIESSVPGGGFASIQGTSMATPIVAGVAGLILTLNPEISLNDLRNTLLQSADPQIYDENFAEGYNFRNYYPKIDKSRVQLLGVGMLDASAAVRGVKAQENDVKNNKRVQIQCATTAQTDAGQIDLRLILFLLPVFFALSLCWFEKKRT